MSGFVLDQGVLRKIQAEAASAVKDAAEHVLEQANRSIPIDTGAMQRSGQVSMNGLTAVVSYDTPYAVRQHEDTRMRHAKGRKAKWLEDTVRSESETVLGFIADRLRKAFA